MVGVVVVVDKGICIDCSGPTKRPDALRCMACYQLSRSEPAQLKVYTCPDCLGPRSRKATVCLSCSYARRGVQSRGPAEPCPECGGRKSKKAERCKDCAARYKAEFGIASGHNPKARVSKTELNKTPPIARVSKTEINKAPTPIGVTLSSVINVIRNGEHFSEWQSYQRESLVPLSEELGEPIQVVPLKRKKLHYDEEQELEKAEISTAKCLYRISVPRTKAVA